MRDFLYGLACAYGGLISGFGVLEADWRRTFWGIAIVATSLIEKKVNG